MSDTLDQDEIDKLMGVSEAPGDGKVSSGEPVDFDLSSQQKIIRGKIPALDIVNDLFARNYQRSLGSQLSTSVSVTPSDVKTMKMQDYISNLMQPTSLNIVKMSPFERASIIVVLEAPLIYSTLNINYGGDPSYVYKIEGSDFSSLEKDYIEGMLLSVFREYTEAWKPIQEVSLELVYNDTNPRYDTSIAPTETVYVSKMDVAFEGGGGHVHFCIPFQVLGPYLDELEEKVKAFQGGVGVSWKDVIAEQVILNKVDIDCVLGEAKLLYKDVKKIEEGDIIPLTYFDKAVVKANGHPIFVGDYGISTSGNKAVVISGGMKHPGIKMGKK